MLNEKNTLSFLWIITMILFIGCQNDTINDTESTEISSASKDIQVTENIMDKSTKPDQPKKEEASNTIDIGGKKIILEPEKNTPTTIDSKTEEGKKKRAEKSILKDEQCCVSLDEVKGCCCNDIIQKYKNLLIADALKEADALKSKDPFYKACLTNLTGFEKRIIAVEDEVWGEE